jgi:predicted nuclease of predicted toxin-antitoxin system
MGNEAMHVLDLGLAQSSDQLIAAQARLREAIVVSKDEDFVALSQDGVWVLWIRLGNCSNEALVDAIGRTLPNVVARFEQGEFLVEVR